MAFPSSIDSFAGFTSSHTLSADNHASQHNSEQAGIVAVETKVGSGASTPTNNTFLAGNGTGTSAWRALTGADVGFNQTTVLQAVFPVGCIYIETTGVNPSTTFGFGTWVAYGAGQTLIGVGTSDQTFAAGASGGESIHTLSSGEMPSHTHTATVTDAGHSHQVQSFNAGSGGGGAPLTSNNSGGSSNPSTTTNTTGVTVSNSSVGGGTSHNNLPPYLVTYFWRRTA
jgi:microcystin-dependent protein